MFTLCFSRPTTCPTPFPYTTLFRSMTKLNRRGKPSKSGRNLTIFSKYLRAGTPTRRHALGRLPTPPPPPENLLLRLHRKLPSEPPASTQEVSESENRLATRGTAHSEVQGMLDALLDALLGPSPPFTFCCPQPIVDEEAGV